MPFEACILKGKYYRDIPHDLCHPDSLRLTVAFSCATHSMETSRLVWIFVCYVRQSLTGKQMNLLNSFFFVHASNFSETTRA